MECGIDIVEIKGFEKLLETESFLNKYFTAQEIEYINSKTNKAQTVAGLYACKEAVLKAFGIGIGGGIDLKEINILHQNGRPKVEITAKIDYHLAELACNQLSVSISHDGEYATAICVIVWLNIFGKYIQTIKDKDKCPFFV